MNKAAALKLIDDHRDATIDPVSMLNWTWLRVIVLQIPEDQWEKYLNDAVETLAK